MRLIARLLMVCLPLSSLPAFAETVGGLYQVREPVASQQPAERDQALNRALETLVIRLAGDAKALDNPALAEARKNPQQLISQFGYEGQSLLVDFDPVTTERTLRQGGVPLWGANRPAILAWWLNQGSDGASLVGDAQEAAKPLRDAAQHRGLPLRLPLADLSEQLVATPETLVATDPEALRPASERYSADALLAVLASEADGKWKAQWHLWLGDNRDQGNVEGADQAAVADAVLLAVSQRLAPRFVVAAGVGQSQVLEVKGADLARYAELSRALEPFGARLVQVEGDLLRYQINASSEQLRAQLALSGLQESAPEAAPVDAGQAPATPGAAPQVQPRDPVLRFHW